MRAHLEEDAAKNVHVAASGRIHGATATLVDFNRGGTPLLEIVTAPDLHSADDAKRFLQLLRQTVVELGLSDAELEKGSMRFDVNVSVRPDRLRRAPHAHRAEEHELVQLRRQGDREGDRAADRDLRVRRDGRAGDAPLRPGERGLAAASLQGGGAGLPLLPRARPRARCTRRRSSSSELRGAGRRAARASGSADRRDALVLRRRRARHRRPRPALVGRRRRGRRSEGDGERARERVRRDRRRSRARRSRPSSRSSSRRAPRSRARRSTRRSPRSATTASAPSRTWRRRRSATSASSTR